MAGSSILWGTTAANEGTLWGSGTTQGSSTLQSNTTGDVINDLE
jgi:hypothetical protein